jgi:uncharacterized membrane protein
MVGGMKRLLPFLAAMSAVCGMAGAPDVQTIIRRSVAANEADWEASPNYSYVERDQEVQINPDGSRKTLKKITYRVVMIEGTPYRIVLARNDQPLSPEERRKENEKLQQAIQSRRSETKQQREERIANYQKNRREERMMIREMANAFEFKLLGEDKLAGHDVYVLQADPRPGYQPPNQRAKALTGMRGKLWIDAQAYQWVRVTAQVEEPVSFHVFLGRLEPGSQIEFEQTPVEDGIWLPKRLVTKLNLRILLLFSHKTEEIQDYWDYRRQTPDLLQASDPQAVIATARQPAGRRPHRCE